MTANMKAKSSYSFFLYPVIHPNNKNETNTEPTRNQHPTKPKPTPNQHRMQCDIACIGKMVTAAVAAFHDLIGSEIVPNAVLV